jgi:hypothetical protein
MPRNKLYNPQELENLFHQYREWSADNPIILVKENYGKLLNVPHHRPLTIKGLFAYAIEHHNTSIHHYFNNTKGAYDEFVSVVRDIKTIIHAELTNLALVGGVKENLASKILGLADELRLHGEVKNTIPEIIKLTTVYTEHNQPTNQ